MTHYWKSTAQRNGHEETPPPPGVSRRGFLEAAGFSIGAVAVAGCHRAPEQNALPYPVQPENARPGRMQQFASTCFGCPAACGLLVSVRDGRPLKMEGMPEHPLSRGGLCAIGQAQPLALYDNHRLTGPMQKGKSEPAEWSDLDKQIAAKLASIKQDGGAVRVVTPTINSPTLLNAIDQFLEQFSDAQHVVFDSSSASAILDAHEQTHGQRVLPRYAFDQAKVIVSLDADFLGNWVSPVEYTAAWKQGRQLPPRPLAHAHHDDEEHSHEDEEHHADEHEAAESAQPAEMSRHVQLEGRMTLTGSNADQRIRLHPGDAEAVLAHLLRRLRRLAGEEAGDGDLPESAVSAEQLDDLAERLWQHKGESLVVCGHNNVAAQVLVNHVNELAGNYGTTLKIAQPSKQRGGNDADLARLAADLDAGKIAGLIVAGIDLTYYLPALADSIEKTQLSISLASHKTDDFASRAQFICPDHHALESWLDAEPVAGLFSICQPTISPLGDTRSAIESFLTWAGTETTALDALKEYWEANVFPQQQDDTNFTRFWDRAVQDGVVEVDAPAWEVAFKATEAPTPSEADNETLTLVVHPSLTIPDVRHAQNPWLQELPDPISKVTWDNYLAVSPALAKKQRLADNDVVQLNASDGGTIELPVFVQPGQHDQVIAVSLGYGAPGTERFKTIGPQWVEAGPTLGANGRVGSSVSHLLNLSDDALRYMQGGVELQKTGRRHVLATTQMHDSIDPIDVTPPGSRGRQALVQETTLAKFNDNPVTAGAPHIHHFDGQLWPNDHPYEGHHWGMAIDLTACTGCSACLIACQSENNVPVVGRDEVRRHREMHWIRIDRYYSGGEDEPDVVHQPMMCQHCANAPCETVCPVLATVHSSEGLNQQAYNRCVGTRYCANNCPYKVRRFNWFNYAHDDTLQNLALNPDVTVRMRGIMEKCSMCVQRIQEAKIESRRLDNDLADGTIQTACQQSCPAGAIVFGDLNALGDDETPPSRVSQAVRDARRFHVLEELNVQPNVAYLRKVRNRSPEDHHD